VRASSRRFHRRDVHPLPGRRRQNQNLTAHGRLVHRANEFEQTVRVIGQFHQASEEHIPFLIRKADEVDQYLGR
jgi:hypothetical protein